MVSKYWPVIKCSPFSFQVKTCTGRTRCVARSAGVFWAGESSLRRSSGRKKERARERETRVFLSRARSFLGLLRRLGRNLLVYVCTVVTAIFDVMTEKD